MTLHQDSSTQYILCKIIVVGGNGNGNQLGHYAYMLAGGIWLPGEEQKEDGVKKEKIA